MELFYSPTSPYSAKVRLAARYLEIDLTETVIDTNADPAGLIANNPLGKIPTLSSEDGPIFDSRAIMQFLNRETDGGLYPEKNAERTKAEVLEALCDGITDCLLAMVYERRQRPAEIIHQPWLDRQWGKAKRGLDHLEANPPKIGKDLHGGHFALAALLGYLGLRFSGEWESDHPALVAWAQEFGERFADYERLSPQAAA